MKNIFDDKGFDIFLYGGVKDLEEEVGPLVYTLFQIPTVTPIPFSCGGHLGSYEEKNWKVKSNRKSYIVTSNSYISFKYISNDRKFEQIINEVLKKYDFSTIENNSENSYRLLLIFDDLVEPISNKEKLELIDSQKKISKKTSLLTFLDFQPDLIDIRKREVEYNLAKQRHQEIGEAWNNLNEILKISYKL